MKKAVWCVLSCLIVAFALTACANKMTLELSYGTREGTYKGDEKDGVPHGQGEFTSQNSEGESWTYTGDFVNGHFEGEGRTVWANGSEEVGFYENDVIVPISGQDLKKVYAAPSDYVNHIIEFTGEVFVAPERDAEAVYLQIMADSENFTDNTIVVIYDTAFEVEANDYVHVIGKITGEFEGSNLFGADITAPQMTAHEYEVVSYTDALSPTLKELFVDVTQEQYGYAVTIQKVEYAATETRVYLAVTNNGNEKFNFHSYSGKIVQGSTQYEATTNWSADYPSVATEILQGVTSEGVMLFPSISEGEEFKIVVAGYSPNFDEQMEDYSFLITP